MSVRGTSSPRNVQQKAKAGGRASGKITRGAEKNQKRIAHSTKIY
jgi:hypothetical protein